MAKKKSEENIIEDLKNNISTEILEK